MDDAIAAWVDGYLAAWNSNDPEQIGALFAADAEYRIEPYAEPWRGREAIVAGWLEHRDEPGASAGDNGACSIRVGEFTLRAGSGDVAVRGEASVVIRPARLEVMPHGTEGRENCLPGMIDRTVFVGSNLQVMVRLATGTLLQVSIPNDGVNLELHEQGRPVSVHAPADALRVLPRTG